MDVEGVAPLHVKVSARMLEQVLVANKPGRKSRGAFRKSGNWIKKKIDKKKLDGLDIPHEGGYEESNADAVNKDHPQQQLQCLQDAHVQHQAEAYC